VTASSVARSPIPPKYIGTPSQSGSTSSPADTGALVSSRPPERSHEAMDRSSGA
jgi:hypothetical protein